MAFQTSTVLVKSWYLGSRGKTPCEIKAVGEISDGKMFGQ